jgi:tetraprenyl-beta-curcumene synthase
VAGKGRRDPKRQPAPRGIAGTRKAREHRGRRAVRHARPAAHRRRTIRALVAFQTAYNYLDALSELPSEDPVANGYQLHRALVIALQPGVAHPDYYTHNPDRGDGGYLAAILDACRDAIAGLPSYPLLAQSAREAAARIVDFQALNLSEEQGGHDALQRWASEATPVAGRLEWWETAAAAGSSLAIHAMITAAATNPHRDARRADPPAEPTACRRASHVIPVRLPTGWLRRSRAPGRSAWVARKSLRR